MKFFFIFFILNLIFSRQIFSLESAYSTQFYNVEINNELILDAKNREIKAIKALSLDSILKNILTSDNYKKILKLINLDTEINKLVQNIIIENEFISADKYKANIKINFDHKEIVKLLRINKINYSDLEIPYSLIVVSESTSLAKYGLTNNNSFYKNNNINYLVSRNLIIPNLTLNDRFILPFNKIEEKNLEALKIFANKYNANNIFIININSLSDNYNFNIKFYSYKDQYIKDVGEITIYKNQDFYMPTFDLINNWWKKENQINNSVINKLLCSLKNQNINELKQINNRINSISQIKSNIIMNINFGFNIHEIAFYGELKNLSNKLFNKDIKLVIDSSKKCLISKTN